MPSNKDKARAAAFKQTVSPQDVIKRSRQQQGSERFYWIASVIVALLLAIFAAQYVGNGSVVSDKSPLLKKKKHLQAVEAYGFHLGNEGLPLAKSVSADPCPIADHNGSKLDCFFVDLFYDIAAEEPDLGHSDSSLGFQGTYGEITPTGVNKIFDLLHVDEFDTFYDLGSGTGKVVLQAFLTTPCRRAAGIELSETRHATATKARSRVLDMFKAEKSSDRLYFKQGDASLVAIDDATIIFMCSLCFPDEVMRKLAWHIASVAAPGTIVLSLKPFEDNPGLSLFGYIPLPMTWTERFEMLVYIVAPRLTVVRPLLGSFFANSSLNSWRDMFRASVAEDVHSIVRSAIDARSTLAANDRVKLEDALFLFDMDSRQASEGIVRRFFRLANTYTVGKEADRTQLAFNQKIKHRSRELVVNAVEQNIEIPADDLAKFALARVQGDSESIIDCIVGDLWPRVLPKLTTEEAKLAVGPGTWQLEMSSLQFQMMLDIITPPVGKDDVLVEVRSGAGQLVTQARMTLGVKRVVGIEAVASRLRMASEVMERIKRCDVTADAEQRLTCPLALSAFVEIGLKDLTREQDIGYILKEDPISASVNIEGSSVIYALTQGWPRGALWYFAAKTANSLPIGEIVVSTSMWPGCQRGLLEIVSKDLEADRWSSGRHIMSWTASVNMVMPSADPSHPLFSAASETTTALRDLLFQRLGIADEFQSKGSTWRTHVISFDNAIEVLSDFGPPFTKGVASMADEALLDSRFRTMIKRFLTEKSRRRNSQPLNANGDVSLQQIVDLLEVALHGEAQSPIECLALDLDILKEHRIYEAKRNSGPKQTSQSIRSKSLYRNCAANGELRTTSIVELMNHHMLRERFDTSSVALVVGDCRAAAVLAMLRVGPRSVRCLDLQSSEAAFEGPLQDLNVTYPGFLHGRHFEQGIASLSMDDTSKSSPLTPQTATVFVLTQCGDAKVSQALVADLLQWLGTDANLLLVSLETVSDSVIASEPLELPRAWALHPDSMTVTANFYQLPQA